MTWNLKRIYISGPWIQPANYFWGQHRPKGKHSPRVINSSGISKIFSFHPIDLKFEDKLHVWSLNSTTNYFWGQICFMDFSNVVLCMTSSSCYSVYLFVSQSPTGRNLKPIFTKLHQVVEVFSTEKTWFWGHRSKVILRSNFWNRHFSSDWLEIWTRFASYITEFGKPKFFWDQKVNSRSNF